MNYYFFLATSVAINVLLASSYSLVLGQAGILSLSHAATMGVGAYVGARSLELSAGNYALALPLVLVITATVAWLIGWLQVRLDDESGILFSLAIAVFSVEVAMQWTTVTGGVSGLVGISRPIAGTFELNSQTEYAIFAVLVTAIALAVLMRISRSRFGLLLRAARDSKDATLAAGWNVQNLQVAAFTVGSSLAGVAGLLYAGQLQFVDPHSFDVHVALVVIIFAVVGGLGNLYGAVVGATFLTLLPELLKDVPLDSRLRPLLERILLGVILILVIRLRPRGFIPERPILRRIDIVREEAGA